MATQVVVCWVVQGITVRLKELNERRRLSKNNTDLDVPFFDRLVPCSSVEVRVLTVRARFDGETGDGTRVALEDLGICSRLIDVRDPKKIQ